MTWKLIFEEISKKEYFKELMSFLDAEYSLKTIYPPREDIFNAFKFTKFEDIKVVILLRKIKI